MPHDKEIHFGFIGPYDVWDITKRLGISLIELETGNDIDSIEQWLNDGQRYGRIECNYDDMNEFTDIKRKSFIDTCTELGYEYIHPTKITSNNPRFSPNENHVYVNTPWGIRDSCPWAMDIQYDPHEVGDTKEEISFGFNLSARYFPSILDMKHESGTLGSIICFSKEFNRQIDICKKNIINHIPEFHDAVVYIRDIFY